MTGLNIYMTGVRELEYKFQRAAEQLRDMRPLMRRIRDQVYKDEFVIFDRGQSSWTPWSEAYAKWRGDNVSHFGYDAPAGEMLGLTGKLQQSLFHEGGENIARVNRKSLTFGTMVPYARYHHEGAGPMAGWPNVERAHTMMPRRDPFEFDKNMKREWRRIVQRYVEGLLR